MSDTRRDQLISFIEKEFVGPDPIDWPGMTQPDGEEILKTDPPRTRYIAGILYPRETSDADADLKEDEQIEGNEAEGEDSGAMPTRIAGSDSIEFLENAEELINRSNAYRQSAISMTVSIHDGDSIKVEVSAGIYTTVSATDPNTGKKVRTYPRTAIHWDNDTAAMPLPTSDNPLVKIKVGCTGLQFDIARRYSIGNDTVFTFTLENAKDRSCASVSDDDCFFQVKFKLVSERGFAPLLEGQRITEDEDYQSNQLLYRNVHDYAIGHGCAANWDDESDTVKEIETAVFPQYEMNPIVPNTSIDGVNLRMIDLSPMGDFENALGELKVLCARYCDWINELRAIRESLDDKYTATASRHIRNCEMCLIRIKKGIELLENDNTVRVAFQYMNLAMLMQQLHFSLPLQRWEFDGVNDIRLVEPTVIPSVEDDSTWYGDKSRYGRWRPFQLAFVLMNLRSMYDRDCSERSIVDLIWFPTGGGKTEAYLGLSAYTIFIRRLLNKSDSGTAILMRYTLRLLTAQQYDRASAMICACETIRKEHKDLFGENRITIGLWVGMSTTPNTVKEAVKAYDKLYGGGGNNPFVMLKCPWCGAQMGPVPKGTQQWDLPGYRKVPRPHGAFGFAFRCRNSRCDYSKEDLPLYVVDETIYDSTPTLLLGTVDKFAMLPFRPQAQSLFGYEEGVKVSTPDLIIQDELHLISGPLGSMVGHYETLINELCTIKLPSGNCIRPKIIASTATISRAKEQCHALYGCKKDDVFQFPPSGLDAGDSFFAKEDKTQNGRRYVGILASGASSDATTAIRLFAGLLYGAKAMKVPTESERDPYWTNMGYYNSIRELGQAATWVRADIDQHLDVMYKRRFEDKRYQTKEEYRQSRRYIWRDEELTSRISGSEVTASLANLGIQYSGKIEDEKTREHPIDICLATNMISVGLDVPRLGLMTVVGQPKTTSEYIQATSRVGRNTKDAPGVVFVLYRPGHPRDKSHYEHFHSYHARVYCNVEPTSVTPFSAPVRERALHAIMVAMMRLESNSIYNADPPKLPSNELFERIRRIIENRVEDIDSEELDATINQMEEIIRNWEDWNPQKWEPAKKADWSYTDAVPLMYAAGTHPNVTWGERGLETPTSMRSVDASCEADVLNNRYVARGE